MEGVNSALSSSSPEEARSRAHHLHGRLIPLCMGDSYLALCSSRPGACVAETRVTEAETGAAITGEEFAPAVAAMAMIRDGK